MAAATQAAYLWLAMTSPPRTLILTGASRGIGHATVAYFMARGWRIITCSREDAPPECRRDTSWSDHIVADLGDPAGQAAFVQQANAIIGDGPIHALVNNAGVSPKTPTRNGWAASTGRSTAGARSSSSTSSPLWSWPAASPPPSTAARARSST